MKISLISSGRADMGALTAVAEELAKYGAETNIFDAGGKPHCDTPVSVAADAAKTMSQVMKSLSQVGPDLVVIAGDRYEALAAANAAYLLKLPIAHLSGGDITQGSQDDSMRHAITKLSHLHFTTCEDSAKRIIQMGEEPWRVHVVGYPGMDELCPKLTKSEDILYKCIRPTTDKFVMVVWHPNSMGDTAAETLEVEKAILILDPKIGVVLIGPNNDAGSSVIEKAFERLLNTRENTYFWGSTSRPIYLKLLNTCTALVGNSSSGFYEAPSFGTPVVNIGDRQNGRIVADNIINCEAKADVILETIKLALTAPRGKGINPYHKETASPKIATAILKSDPEKLLRKQFNDIQQTMGSDSQRKGLGALPKRGVNKVGGSPLWPDPSQLTFWGEAS